MYPGGLMTVLSEADPADKADVYGQLGLTLTYDPAARRVKAEARPESIMYVGTCPRGDSVPPRGGTSPNRGSITSPS
jgi:site-specific DNA recombinase